MGDPGRRAGREPAQVPERVLAERGPVLRRTLRGLSDEVLAALVRGLERDGERLVAGRLFRGSGGGGCAVGVTLRELEPEKYSIGGLRFWLRHGWRRRVRWYPGLAAAQPRFQHLEWTFDRAVRATAAGRRRSGRREAAVVVGRWFHAEALAELDWRRLSSASTSPRLRAAA